MFAVLTDKVTLYVDGPYIQEPSSTVAEAS